MPEKKNVASSQETLLKVEHLCQYFKEIRQWMMSALK